MSLELSIQRRTHFNTDEDTMERKETVKVILDKMIPRVQVEGLALNRKIELPELHVGFCHFHSFRKEKRK